VKEQTDVREVDSMKRPRSHEIDELAMRVFECALPPSWVVNKQPLDYAKDYSVEIGEAGNLTGITFLVQLKGQESPSMSKDAKHATFWLKRKYAVYYADKVRLPVFLVLVDVTKKVGYWVFVQAHLLDDLRGKKWRKNSTVPIRVPTQNQLTDTVALRKAAEAATQYMNALHPTSIKTAIKAHQLRLESLDPRLGVQIDVINEREFVTVLPKEEVEVRLIFKGEPGVLSPKLDNLFGRGLPTPFGPDEIEVTGSPLFTEAFKSGGILAVAGTFEGTVSLLAQDDSAYILSRLENIPGTLAGGHNECRFDGQLAGSPLKLHITARREGGSAPIRFGFDMRRWRGQPLLLLPYFDQIAAFFEGVRGCTLIELKCFLQGNEFFGGRIHQKDLGIFKGLAAFLPVLTKAREICRLAGINPILNEKIDREKAQEIDELHKLLTDREFRRKMPGATISCSLSRASVQNLLKMPLLLGGPLVFQTVEDQKIPLFGQEVDVRKLEHNFTHVKLASTKKELRERLTGTKARHIKVAFACTDHSELIVRSVTKHQSPGG
jgi:hypothetical protein